MPEAADAREKESVNARDIPDDDTPLMSASECERLACLQLLLDANADVSLLNNAGDNVLNYAIDVPEDTTAHRVPGMAFSLLSCNTNVTDIQIDECATQDMIDAHIAEYKQVHNFIDEHHSILEHALSHDVQTDGYPLRFM
jgi:hypothetical protein